MPLEKSAGAVIFRKEGDKIYYLLLNYPSSAKAAKNYWDFPKGHIENREEIEDTVKREVREETGLTEIKFIPGFKEVIKYFFRFKSKNIFKIVIFLLAKTKEKEIKISAEHIGYKWLPYEEAIKKLTFKNAKQILKKANEFLKLKTRNEKRKTTIEN